MTRRSGSARPQVALRAVAAGDTEYLLWLHEASMRPYIEAVWGWDPEFQVRYFREHFQPERLRVIEADGERVGVMGYDLDDERLYVGPFEIDPSAQGRGIGAAALRQLFDLADAAGVPTTLQVLKVNPRARALYERLGFETTGETETHVLLRRPRSVPPSLDLHNDRRD